MDAFEVRDKIDEIINEFGNFPVKIPDQLEAKWLQDVTDVRFERAGDGVIIIAAGD